VDGTHAGAVHEELQPVAGLILEQFVEECPPWEQGKRVRRKEHQRQCMTN